MRWVEPTIAGVRRFISDITYTGRYIYARQHWKDVQAGKEPIPAYRPIGQFVEILEHHELYITLDEFRENQKTLELNRRTPVHAHLGRGHALVQGICRCALHGTIMGVHYHPTARRHDWRLQCLGDYVKGGKACGSVPGSLIESRIVEAVLARLDEGVLKEARRVWKEQRQAWKRVQRSASDLVRHQEDDVARLRRKILDDDGSRPHLRSMLEDEYEKEARKLVALRKDSSKQQEPPDPFSEAAWEELLRLCSDRQAIWRAKTTTDHDRKQLIRILVDRVVIETIESERIVLRIAWADGVEPTPLEILRSAYYRRLLWEWHLAGGSPAEAVARLATMGARTQQGRPFSIETVRTTLAYRRKQEQLSAPGMSAPPVTWRTVIVMRELHAAGLSAGDIASRLNKKGLLTRFQREWSASSVRRALAERTSRPCVDR